MVIFDQENHKYTNPSNNKVYISVSQLLKLYKEPFDSDFFANKVAKRDGKTKEQVLQEWNKKTQEACDKGTEIHNIFETYLTTGKVDRKNKKYVDELKKVFNKNDYKELHSEMILANDVYEVAGTSDIIADVNDKYFDVLDFKTNSKFDFFSKYGKFFKVPLNNIQECHYTSYSLQLSLYAFLYSAVSNKKVRQISILYHDGTQFHRYPVPYLYWEVTALLNHYGKTLSSKS